VLRSAWILGAGSLLTFWHAGRVLFLSFSRNPEALCRSCDSMARRWSRAVLKLAGVSVQVDGVENLALDGAFIIIANHESWFDMWALAGCLPIDARFAAKKELERIPVFGRAWRACGHISIHRAHHASAIGSMTRAGLQIKDQDLNMVFFAQGTQCLVGRCIPSRRAHL
jgi:1-acyl-sn-glycerol-3-phosphate acyltransferase